MIDAMPLKILGGAKRLCDGTTRRELLTVGGLGLAGVAAPALFGSLFGEKVRANESDARPSLPGFGRAKNVILLYLFGGASHLETFDVKPHAPVEVRGKLTAIPTAQLGLSICECLPRTAKMMDRVAVVRSLNHPWNFHGMQYATTGLAVGSVPVEETVVHPLHQPYVGSVASYFRNRNDRAKSAQKGIAGDVPDNIVLPFPLSSRRPASYLYAKPYGAFLGSEYDPIVTDYRGEPTRSMVRRSFGAPAEIRDPFLGIDRDCRFLISSEAEMPFDVTVDRLNQRRSLLDQLEAARRELDRKSLPASMDHKREMAMSLLDSSAIRSALAIDQESKATRESYGMTLFGQAVLQARRLVEAGSRFVTVVWDEYGQLNSGWDTHVDHYNRLQNDLLPGFDLAFSSLIRDLEDRGLLEETLVMVTSEMGRTPRFEGDGRGHWGRAYSNVLAGGGIARGIVVGKTDSIGASVADRPVSSKDILATAYHLMGINPAATIPDKLGRPTSLVHDGKVVAELLA